MNAPNLDRMWESFVHIGSVEYVRVYGYLDVLRAQIARVIADLRSAGLVDWYCLLVHGADEGVPCGPADRDCYWHVRVSLAEGYLATTTSAGAWHARIGNAPLMSQTLIHVVRQRKAALHTLGPGRRIERLVVHGIDRRHEVAPDV